MGENALVEMPFTVTVNSAVGGLGGVSSQAVMLICI